jgi:hypothetical protein
VNQTALQLRPIEDSSPRQISLVQAIAETLKVRFNVVEPVTQRIPGCLARQLRDGGRHTKATAHISATLSFVRRLQLKMETPQALLSAQPITPFSAAFCWRLRQR